MSRHIFCCYRKRWICILDHVFFCHSRRFCDLHDRHIMGADWVEGRDNL